MTLSVLQLNINADNYWDTLIPFLTSHDFDIINMQEVTGKNTRLGNIFSERDCFAELKKILGENYNGELSITDRATSDPIHSYFGNATFFKKSFQLIQKQEIVMYENAEPFSSEETDFKTAGRKILDLTLDINGTQVRVLNLHFAWAPTPVQQPHHTAQGKILIDHIKTVSSPFILTGDFNVKPDQPLMQELNTLAHNVTAEHNVTNTLNERTHYVKKLFPPGLAVDNIYVSTDITVNSFSVLEKEDISDHLGLIAEITLP